MSINCFTSSPRYLSDLRLRPHWGTPVHNIGGLPFPRPRDLCRPPPQMRISDDATDWKMRQMVQDKTDSKTPQDWLDTVVSPGMC